MERPRAICFASVCISSTSFLALVLLLVVGLALVIYGREDLFVNSNQSRSEGSMGNDLTPAEEREQEIAAAVKGRGGPPREHGYTWLDQLRARYEATRAIDQQRLYDPLTAPYRRYEWQAFAPPLATPWNVPTQGEAGPFQVVGYLYQGTGEESSGGKDSRKKRGSSENLETRNLIRLFGRRLDRNRYEYYTTAPNDPALKVPLKVRGDNEIMNDDRVNVPGFTHPFKAVIYDVEDLRYVPY